MKSKDHLAFVNIKRDSIRSNAAYFERRLKRELQQDFVHKLPRTMPVYQWALASLIPCRKVFAEQRGGQPVLRIDHLDGFSQAATRNPRTIIINFARTSLPAG